jgi:hypothetical protein
LGFGERGRSLRNRVLLEESADMTAYEFYSCDDFGELNFIGILPERRIDPKRITHDSIINWAWKLLGEESGVNNIFYSTVNLEKSKNGKFYPTPISQKEL